MKDPRVQAAIVLFQAAHHLSISALKMLDADPDGFDPDDIAAVLQAVGMKPEPETEEIDTHNATEIDPEWFKPNSKNHHLTLKGAKHIYSLFDQGMTPHQASKAMGIYFRAAQLRFDRYQKGER